MNGPTRAIRVAVAMAGDSAAHRTGKRALPACIVSAGDLGRDLAPDLANNPSRGLAEGF
jgi:hypothetical protein